MSLFNEPDHASVKQTILSIWCDLRAAGKIRLSVDKSPYTQQFEMIYSRVLSCFPGLTRKEVYDHLMNLRKQGLCPMSDSEPEEA